MTHEIERKFLFKGYPDSLIEFSPPEVIKQGYIFAEMEKHLRIRIIRSFFGNETGILGLKYTDPKKIREEYEYSVDIRDAYNMYDRCDWILEKKRGSISLDGLTYDFDRYPNKLQVVEVEFPDKARCDSFVPNDWLGEEITGVAEYSNITLAKERLIFK